jgi:glycosyltransferase involved in cell wall biosynthesis
VERQLSDFSYVFMTAGFSKLRNVWILNHYAVPPGASGGTRHFNLALNLPKNGWSASIIAASVEHLSGKQRLSGNERFRLEIHKSVPFLWIRTLGYQGNGSARIRNMAEYAMHALYPSYTKDLPKPDAIIGSSVHLLAAVAGAVLARRFHVPFIFEVRDLWPQTLIDLGRIGGNSLTARGMRAVESWLYRKADRIVTLLPHVDDYIRQFGISRSKVVWIPNGVELAGFPDPGPPAPKQDQTFVLMYFGSHGQANGLENVLKAMKLLQDDGDAGRLQLRMIGDGPAKAGLQCLAERLNLHNISFESPVPKSSVPDLAAQADAFVLSVLDRPNLYRYGISMNKMYDYFAGRRPVVLASAAINDPVRDAGAGLTVPPEDPVALAAAMKELMAMSAEERDRMGKAGRNYVEIHNDFGVLAKDLADVLNDCAKM